MMLLKENVYNAKIKNIEAEAEYLFNLTQSGKRFVLSPHYNWCNSFLFLNATKLYQLKVKNSEKKI